MDKSIKHWQDLYYTAKSDYDCAIENMNDNELSYTGKRPIYNDKGIKAKKQTVNTRKLTFELIESQTDVTIPMPKVTSKKGHEDRAKMIEDMIRCELDRLPIEEIADQQSRTTPICGASMFFCEWNNSLKTHDTVGDIKVRNLHPNQVIPQQGVFDLEDMDYLFLTFEQSKDYVKRVYGVDVTTEGDESEDQPYDHMCTHVFCYYRNDDGAIGLISWVGDVEVQNYDNYFARQQEGKKLDKESITLITGEVIEVPYYVPDMFPVIIRKNVSVLNKFTGDSDVDYIKDHQNEISIYMAKIKDKMLKGGSLVTLPDNIKFEANDDEMKILKIKDIADMQKISVKTLQADISKDSALLENNYQYARQAIGITDSFQGRSDSTATSGKAKQVQAAQTAGRFASKKAMKDYAFSKLYECMFKYLIAYADDLRSYVKVDEDGNKTTGYFDKKLFIDKDPDTGEWYYDDEFVFSTDISGSLANDRQAMWQETRSNLESGAYGDPTDLNTLKMYWTTMKELHYPGSDAALITIGERLSAQAAMAEQQIAADRVQQPDVAGSTLSAIGG